MADNTPEAAKRLSLDDFLKEQDKATNKVTIEPIADKQDSVKLTPYIGGKGCQCNLSISVPRAAIKLVEPTGEIHLCCGKTLRVVQVEFAEGHSISYPEMLAQLSTRPLSVHHEHVEPVQQFAGAPVWAGTGMVTHQETLPHPVWAGHASLYSAQGLPPCGGCLCQNQLTGRYCCRPVDFTGNCDHTCYNSVC
jgi:hypothetical protein